MFFGITRLITLFSNCLRIIVVWYAPFIHTSTFCSSKAPDTKARNLSWIDFGFISGIGISRSAQFPSDHLPHGSWIGQALPKYGLPVPPSANESAWFNLIGFSKRKDGTFLSCSQFMVCASNLGYAPAIRPWLDKNAFSARLGYTYK